MRTIVLVLCVWLCQANKEPCEHPQINQGFVAPLKKTYEHNTKVSYSCNRGLKPALKTWWGELLCNNGKWTPSPLCIPVTHCIVPDVKNSVSLQSRPIATNNNITIICNEGFSANGQSHVKITCKNGTWIGLQECKRKASACDAPAKVENAMITKPYKDTFEESNTVEYVCRKGFRLEGNKNSTCWNGTWTNEAIKCVEVVTLHVSNCGDYPAIENGVVYEEKDGMALTIKCVSYYKHEGPEKVICESRKWSELPVCKAPCKLDQSKFLKHGAEDKVWVTETGWTNVKCDNGALSRLTDV